MKSKTIFTISMIALLSIFLTSFVSAISVTSVDFLQTDPITVDHDVGSFAINFDVKTGGTVDSNIDLTYTVKSATGGTVSTSDVILTPSSKTLSNVVAGSTASEQITVSLASQKSGEFKVEVSADPINPTTASTVTKEITVKIKDSKALEITEKQALTQNQNGTIEIKNIGNQGLSNIVFSQAGDFTSVFTPATITFLNVGDSQDIGLSGVNLNELPFGTNNLRVTAQTNTKDATSNTLQFTINRGFCKAGEVGGNLAIKDFEVNNLGDGSDDEWKILDIVEVDVEVKNEGDDKIRDIFVELALFDDEGNDVTSDLEFDNSEEEEIDIGNLDDRKDDTATFKFKVTADLDRSNYKLAVKAYSDDLGETVECTDSSGDLSNEFFELIELDRETDEEDFLKIDEIRINPADVTCGDTVDLGFDMVNVGDENIEDRFKINLDSNPLELSLSQEIRKDIDEGDTERIAFSFKIPENLEDGSYPLRISSEHDYRDSTDSYRVTSSEEVSVLLTVFGCSLSGTPGGVMTGGVVALSASLDSDAKAGEELIVRATVTNLGDDTANFIISASGFESWADINAISDRLLTLGSGETREITLSFNVDEDATGQQSFILEARSGDNIESREVVVNLESASSGAGSPQFNLSGDNNLLWLIGIINVVLIILIIVVAVRISRR